MCALEVMLQRRSGESESRTTVHSQWNFEYCVMALLHASVDICFENLVFQRKPPTTKAVASDPDAPEVNLDLCPPYDLLVVCSVVQIKEN